jgi:glutamate-5-semialdehyde dehydrogenase
MPSGTTFVRDGAAPFEVPACLERARAAARGLPRADRRAGLASVADALEQATGAVLEANRQDVAREREAGTPEALVDRLELDAGRLAAMAQAVRTIAALPDPVARVVDGWTLPNGLRVQQRTVPFGVIAVVYESRPNVTVDAAALALRAGSAAVLRGSANALRSNRALVHAMRDGLAREGLPSDAVQLIDDPARERVTELLRARGLVDLVIPRGGAELIDHVVRTAQVPVIETGVGNCHVYVHADAEPQMATAIVMNAKLQRPGVCNAAETLLVHAGVASAWLPATLATLHAHGVRLHGCERTRVCAEGVPVEPASEADWATEYLGPELAVRVVDDLEAALEHIARHGSRHSEAIVTSSSDAGRRFQDEVDAAAVYVNASTRFTDGFEFGFGAEIGISTQKLHARGPLGLAQLVTTKYVLDGNGQVRG